MNAEKTLNTYCPECDCEVDARLERRTETLPVKGEPTSYDAEVAVCPCCGEAIGDSRVEEGNLRRAYSAYCVAHGLMAPDEVKELRNSYGLSLREFSKFLGFGFFLSGLRLFRLLCGSCCGLLGLSLRCALLCLQLTLQLQLLLLLLLVVAVH